MRDDAAFEAHLAQAYRRFLEDTPTDVDAMAVAASVAGAAVRGRGWRIAWSLTGVRGLAPLLSLALLLGALLGMAMLSGSGPASQPAASRACPSGADPDEPGPVDQARPATGAPASLVAIDRQSGRLVVVAPSSDDTRSETWAFDLCTNTWQRMSAAGGPTGRPNWVSLVYDEGSDLVVAFDEYRGVNAYDVDRDRWLPRDLVPLELGLTGDTRGYGNVRYVFGPDADRIFAFVAVDPAAGHVAVWTYDVDADAWERAPWTGEAPYIHGSGDHQLVAYDRSVGRFIAVNTEIRRTWQYDPASGAWTTGAAPPELLPGYFDSGGEMAYDERIGRSVVTSGIDVVFYDAAADAWQRTTVNEGMLGEGVTLGQLDRRMHSLAYDPVNARLVLLGGTTGVAVDTNEQIYPDDVLAYDASAHLGSLKEEGRTMERTTRAIFVALLIATAPAAVDASSPPPDAQPVVVTGSEQRTCLPSVCTGTHEASDPRVSGDLTAGFEADCWEQDVCTFSGSIKLENEDGTWEGEWTGFRDASGQHRTVGWMAGRGAYEGWSYILNLVEPELEPGVHFKGIIFPGELPASVGGGTPDGE